MRELSLAEVNAVAGAGFWDDLCEWFNHLTTDPGNGCYVMDIFSNGQCSESKEKVQYIQELQAWQVCLTENGLSNPQTPAQVAEAVKDCGPVPVFKGGGGGKAGPRTQEN